jgi:hypothetical protein
MDQTQITRAIDKAAELARADFRTDGPVWAPLEAVLPAAELDGWMYMGQTTTTAGTPVFMYKHGITRRYLHLDATCRAYRYDGRTGAYSLADLDERIGHAYADLAALGASRSTAYNDEYIAARNAALAAAGWAVVHAG